MTATGASAADGVALKQHFLVSPGSLSAALVAVGQQSRQSIIFNPKDVQGLPAPRIDGDYETQELLQKLLSPLGLTYRQDSEGAFIVRAQGSTPKESQAEEITLAPMVVLGAKSPEQSVITRTTETTRTGALLESTPQSITVINSAIMEAQNAQTASDALKNVAGVAVIPTSLGGTSVNIRGYESTVTSEGLRSNSISSPLSVPAIALESVEAIKGPDALISGASSPGGTINLVYKKPQLEDAHELRLGYGSFDEKELSLDSTGAIAGSEHLSYRLIYNGKQSDKNAADYDGLKQFYIAPSVRWQDNWTDLTIKYTTIERRNPFQPYTVGYEGKPWTGHFPKPLGNTQDSVHLKQNDFAYTLKHTLSDNWEYNSKGNYSQASYYSYGWYSASTLDRSGDLLLNHFYQGAEVHQFTSDNFLRGTYTWGDLTSTSVVGFNATRSRSVTNQQTSFDAPITINIFEPMPDLKSAKASYLKRFRESIPIGAYLQEQLSYGKWNLATGLRFDSTWNGVFRRQEGTDSQNNQEWSPSIGISYQAKDWMTIYGSHQQSYQSPSYFDVNGNLLPPQISKQNEVGAKLNLLDDKLVVTGAFYRTTFSNYASLDMEQGAYVATAGYTSRGFELEAQGKLADNLSVVGHYSQSITNFADDQNTQAALPKHKASIWSGYQFNEGILKGITAGVGLYYSGTAYLNRDKSYKIPAQVETDLNLGYTLGHYGLDLSVRNIFNEDLYVTSMDGTPTFISLQQPRTVQITASYHF